jgi:protein TonB
MHTRFARLARVVAPVFVAVALAVTPKLAAAQDIYGPQDLSAPPKLVSPAATARLIARSYPEQLRSSGTGGTVEIQFVINADGKVDATSIQIVDAPVAALGTAAKAVVEKMEFVPGKKDGQAVRARVSLPIQYKP